MKVNTRFTVALHVLTLIELCSNKGIVISSEKMALSVQTNSAVIRKLLAQLRKAGLIETRHGVAGSTLKKPPKDISLLVVYHAVKKPEDTIFDMHQNTNPNCYVGGSIHEAVLPILNNLEESIEEKLSSFTLDDVIRPIAEKSAINLNH